MESGQEWAGTRILFELEGRAEKTLLRFTHADWLEETDYFWSCNTTWGGLAAEGKGEGPLFTADGLSY